MKKFYYETMVRESHLDTFGHVNNATYLEIYEDARWDMLEEQKLSLETIQQSQKGPVILEVNVKYKRELKNREKIKIESYAGELKKKYVEFHQIMYKEDGKVASEAMFKIAYFDMKERKLLSADPDWLKAFGL
jgi:thioesterase-3